MSEQSTLITDPARLDLIARIYGLWERLVAHCNEQGDPDHVALMRGTAYLVYVIQQVSPGSGERRWIDDPHTSAANARLIAAAPDLLAALIRLTDYVTASGVEEDAEDAYEDACAAIAKARGEQQ